MALGVNRSRLIGTVLALGALTMGVGCAPAPTVTIHDARLRAEAGAHVYHRPAPEVVADVRAELVAEGYALEPVGEDGLVHTQWKSLIDGEEFATLRERYVVLVKRLTPHHCRVEALKITMSTLGMDMFIALKGPLPAAVNARYVSYSLYGHGPARDAVPRAYARDFGLEWRLFRRIDPDQARRAESIATRE